LEWLTSELDSYSILAQFSLAQVHFEHSKPHHVRIGNYFQHR
jgi:hypothetical protein